MKEDFYPALVESQFYHIYNRGNNRENIFYKHENYVYFLRKYAEYLSPFLETYAYCLLPNHFFNLLVRVKRVEDVVASARLSKFQKLGKSLIEVDEIISEAFRRFFMSYAKAINKQQGRVGSLFQKNFKRKHIDNERYFTSVVHYLHTNPQLHGICEDYREYVHSSYGRLLIDKPSQLQKRTVWDWFGGKEGFVLFHEDNSKVGLEKSKIALEDD